jgi:hypothetical protein
MFKIERIGGWNYWVEDNGRIRMFTIAERDKGAALNRLRELFPQAHPVSQEAVPAVLIEKLQIPQREWMEWVMADPSRKGFSGPTA